MKINNSVWIFHPASFVHDELILRKISKRQLLKAEKKFTRRSYWIREFLHNIGVTERTMDLIADFLEHYLGIEKSFWINSYNSYMEALKSGNYQFIQDGKYKFIKYKHRTLEKISDDRNLS